MTRLFGCFRAERDLLLSEFAAASREQADLLAQAVLFEAAETFDGMTAFVERSQAKRRSPGATELSSNGRSQVLAVCSSIRSSR
jgi:hypothetical protein